MEKIKDIIELPEIKLVIELDDTERDPEGLMSSFILTKETEESLKIIFNKIDKNEGSGIFVKGNYGSGKSHLLSYIFLLLKNKPDLEILEKFNNIKSSEIKLIKISLVKYPSINTLESIVLSIFGYEAENFNRENVFKDLIKIPTVIIIDELSEFLRSKPNPSSFYEDIRFLQFLGEYSFSNPLWIIASLQEWIEETGHISSNIFNRIKDRYPVRINLSVSHIEDIINQRIILKKENALNKIKEVFQELKKYYPGINLTFDYFKKTYPLHPFTVRFLNGLSIVFSQHRGIIHFVLNETKKILNENMDYLITPDIIYDHFEERIKEIPEYSSLSKIVFDYYKTRINDIFLKPAHKEIALSVIKILILNEISPFEKRKNHQQISEILLKKISTLSNEVNYEFIKDGILEPLVSQKMYIMKENELYYIDPKVNEGIKIKNKIKKEKEKLQDRNYLFDQISNNINLPFLPLNIIKEGRKYRILWQNSFREIVVLSGMPDHLKRDDIMRMLSATESKHDGYLVILSQFGDEKKWIYDLKNSINSNFLVSIIFWIPRNFTDEELNFIEEFIAKNSLLTELQNLANETKKDFTEFKEIIIKSYFEGEIIYGNGKIEKNLTGIGYLPIEKLLSHLFNHSLNILHPEHFKVMPRIDFYALNHLKGLFNNFLKKGKISLIDAETRGLTAFIKSILEPLSIVKTKSSNFVISLEPENELISFLLNQIESEENIFKIKLALKKGKWGLDIDQINLLIAAGVFTGLVIPYKDNEIVELKDYSQLNEEITKLKPGKTISSELLGAIHYGDFIWSQVEDIPTFSTQKKMWETIIIFTREGRKLVERLNVNYNKFREYSIIKKLNIDFSIINKFLILLKSINYSMHPIEGIEKILIFLRNNTNAKIEFDFLKKLDVFFEEQFTILNKYYLYVNDNSLIIPDNLNEKTEALKNCIIIYLNNFQDFDSVKNKWNEFYEKYIEIYKEKHNEYYNADIYKIKGEIEQDEFYMILKKIGNYIKSITFEDDFWEIKSEINKLPIPCNNDLNNELFFKPACSCGFKINSNPATSQLNFIKKCKNGLTGFFKLIKNPEYRERIEVYILGLKESGKSELIDKLYTIINLNTDKINFKMIPYSLNEEVLIELENALKGKWKIREIKINDFFDKIKDRRIKYNDIKNIFFDWIGIEEDSILWIKDQSGFDYDIIEKNFNKYGTKFNRVINDIKIIPINKNDKIEDIEEIIEKFPFINELNFLNYSTEELIDFLNNECFDFLKKKLREEIFNRAWLSPLSSKEINNVNDIFLKNILEYIKIANEDEKSPGIYLFTNIISRLNYLFELISCENEIKEKINNNVIDKLENKLNLYKNQFEKNNNRYDKCLKIGDVIDKLNGNVVIIDSLRYDLWLVLKEVLEQEGFKIKDYPYQINSPSTTLEFRKALNITDQSGILNNKSYILLKWAEKISKRELKKVLSEKKDIKFLHFNFIDSRIHASTIEPYPLYSIIINEFKNAIITILKEITPLIIISDHGFIDTKKLHERYKHGGSSSWETILPFAEIN